MNESAERTGRTALVLLSGGMDSTVLLHQVRAQAPAASIEALSFNYGQRHSRELECARTQARAALVSTHHVIDISFLGPLLQEGSTLLAGGQEVPELAQVAESDRDQPPTYVPNRNMMLLSMAAARAETIGATQVYYGAQAQDEYGYWDCTQSFLDRINAVLALNRRNGIIINAPFVAWSKAQIAARGAKLGVDFAQTWSCYRGGETPCGVCPTCIERATAFRDAGLQDPLLF